jgi:hypothetical protein
MYEVGMRAIAAAAETRGKEVLFREAMRSFLSKGGNSRS